MNHRFVAALVRTLGAFQAGVGVHLIVPPAWHPLLAAAAVAALVFLAGRTLEQRPSIQEVVGFGYLAPLAAAAAAMLLVRAPATWPLAAGLLRAFLAAVVVKTPLPAYLACVGYACFVASRKPKGKDIYC